MKTKQPLTYYSNLVALKAYLLTNIASIERKLDMACYRGVGDETSFECDTVGCILGQATAVPELQKYIPIRDGKIKFQDFAENAFNIEPYTQSWHTLFGAFNPNSVTAFIKRLNKYLKRVYPQYHKGD